MHLLLASAGDAFVIARENGRYARAAVEEKLAQLARNGHFLEVRDTSGMRSTMIRTIVDFLDELA
jgi:hypothetical protein